MLLVIDCNNKGSCPKKMPTIDTLDALGLFHLFHLCRLFRLSVLLSGVFDISLELAPYHKAIPFDPNG